MYLFFESVWKLHIGEIPEKPHEFIDEIEQYDIWEEYRNEIAAIKQNALTVGNPKVLKQFGYLELPINGDFVKWPGGYKKKKQAYITDSGAAQYRTVAILTLPEHVLTKESISSMKFKPEEKKNTMENMTTSICPKCGTELSNLDRLHFGMCSKCFGYDCTKTASGSVAAPKRVCPKCGSGKVIMFTSDDDLCQSCGATFPGVLNGSSELASLRQQLKEREEVIKGLLPLAERMGSILGTAANEYYKAIIERARKLISK